MNNDVLYIALGLLTIFLARQIFPWRVSVDSYKSSVYHTVVFLVVIIVIAMLAYGIAYGYEELNATL